MLVLLKVETQTHTLNFGCVLQNKILDTWKIKLHPLFAELRPHSLTFRFVVVTRKGTDVQQQPWRGLRVDCLRRGKGTKCFAVCFLKGKEFRNELWLQGKSFSSFEGGVLNITAK